MNKKNVKVDSGYVLRRINEARVKEELAIPIYSSHIKQTLFWSGLPEASRDKIISGLKTLQNDSMKHVRILKAVAKNYLKDNK